MEEKHTSATSAHGLTCMHATSDVAHGADRPVMTCVICNKSFVSVEDLDNHRCEGQLVVNKRKYVPEEVLF